MHYMFELEMSVIGQGSFLALSYPRPDWLEAATVASRR